MFNNHVDVHGRSPLSREKKKKREKIMYHCYRRDPLEFIG